MARNRLILWVVILVLSLVVQGCGSAQTPTDGGQVREQKTSPLLPVPQVSPLTVATETLATSPIPTATPKSLPLVVLHTNDNWGETEPCG